MWIPCEFHLSNINSQIVLIVCPVADGQTQLLLLAGLVELHLLVGHRMEERLKLHLHTGPPIHACLCVLGCHLILQVILPVHLLVGDIQVVIIILKNTAADRETDRNQLSGLTGLVRGVPLPKTGEDVQLIQPIWCHEVGRRRGRWWRGRVAALVVEVTSSALPHSYNVLEGDVSLRAAVNTVGD